MSAGVSVSPVEPGKGRKKHSDLSKWAKNLLKAARHAPKQPPMYPNCKHNGKTYRCASLQMVDIADFHSMFYSTNVKIEQDKFILKYISVEKPQRDRAEKHNSLKKKIAVKYFVKVKGTNKFQIQVCQQAFLNILNISKDRVQRIARHYLSTAMLPKEKRGGSTLPVIYKQKIESVKEFIEKLNLVQ